MSADDQLDIDAVVRGYQAAISELDRQVASGHLRQSTVGPIGIVAVSGSINVTKLVKAILEAVLNRRPVDAALDLP